jgi:hypothetical protein
MMMTINSLCLFSMTDFLDQVLRWKDQFGKFFPVISVNLLRFPSFMSPLALPAHLKNHCRENLSAWLDKNKSHPLFQECEHDGIRRLIDYLEAVDSPHRRTSSLMSQWRDFRAFYLQYDERRGKSFTETFPPILVDWFRSLPDTKTDIQNLVDGDATLFWKENEQLKELAEREGWILDAESENPG